MVHQSGLILLSSRVGNAICTEFSAADGNEAAAEKPPAVVAPGKLRCTWSERNKRLRPPGRDGFLDEKNYRGRMPEKHMLLLADYTPDTAPVDLKQSDRPAAADCSEDNLETPPFGFG